MTIEKNGPILEEGGYSDGLGQPRDGQDDRPTPGTDSMTDRLTSGLWVLILAEELEQPHLPVGLEMPTRPKATCLFFDTEMHVITCCIRGHVIRCSLASGMRVECHARPERRPSSQHCRTTRGLSGEAEPAPLFPL